MKSLSFLHAKKSLKMDFFSNVLKFKCNKLIPNEFWSFDLITRNFDFLHNRDAKILKRARDGWTLTFSEKYRFFCWHSVKEFSSHTLALQELYSHTFCTTNPSQNSKSQKIKNSKLWNTQDKQTDWTNLSDDWLKNYK